MCVRAYISKGRARKKIRRKRTDNDLLPDVSMGRNRKYFFFVDPFSCRTRSIAGVVSFFSACAETADEAARRLGEKKRMESQGHWGKNGIEPTQKKKKSRTR